MSRAKRERHPARLVSVSSCLLAIESRYYQQQSLLSTEDQQTIERLLRQVHARRSGSQRPRAFRYLAQVERLLR